MFIDEAEISVQAGNGGDGCVSFRREKHVAFGGPDGGAGGDGGSVILLGSSPVETLLDFKGKHHWNAKNGMPGEGRNKTGACADDLIISLPVGTLVYDRETGLLLKDLHEDGVECRIVRGGKGGRGNQSFATATQQAPREHEPGGRGESRELRLELKLIADVGLVGFPNAGKSTLLSRISRARPKIGAYPFTTLKPQLGIVEISGERRFVVADIPGLIEGAHQGAGLGDAFLRHIERTKIIVHLVDICPIEGQTPQQAYHAIRRELEKYSKALADKEEIVVANKIDLIDADEEVRELSEAIGREVIGISAVTGSGLPELSERLWAMIGSTKAPLERAFDLPVPPHARPSDAPPSHSPPSHSGTGDE
ncbi:MAG: GTPase ObgE [Planctomycetes bacterium]|nr:GTPase ObgE [Planctomycetota bacterium]